MTVQLSSSQMQPTILLLLMDGTRLGSSLVPEAAFGGSILYGSSPFCAAIMISLSSPVACSSSVGTPPFFPSHRGSLVVDFPYNQVMRVYWLVAGKGFECWSSAFSALQVLVFQGHPAPSSEGTLKAGSIGWAAEITARPDRAPAPGA